MLYSSSDIAYVLFAAIMAECFHQLPQQWVFRHSGQHQIEAAEYGVLNLKLNRFNFSKKTIQLHEVSSRSNTQLADRTRQGQRLPDAIFPLPCPTC